jgi:hypothetical protein
MVQFVPFVAIGFLGVVAGWYLHMKVGQKAQAAVDTAAAAVAEVKKEV